MRTLPLLLLPLLLAGCVKQSASYFIDKERDFAITVRAEQQYFWDDQADLVLVMANMPQCQRRYPIATVPVSEIVVELFDAGDGVYTMRAGSEVWQIQSQDCTQLGAPQPEAMGEPVAIFRIGRGEKMDLELPNAAAAPAAAETAPQ